MKGRGKGALAAIIALKLVCCGGLLVAMGVISVGSILTLLDHTLFQMTGVVLLLACVAWWLVVRRSGTATCLHDPGLSKQDLSGQEPLPRQHLH